MGVAANLQLLADAGTSIQQFVSVFVGVYTLVIIAYVILSIVPPGTASILTQLREFLHGVCAPYLAIFRRFVPPIGPLDLSPMVAIFSLVLGGQLLNAAIGGIL